MCGQGVRIKDNTLRLLTFGPLPQVLGHYIFQRCPPLPASPGGEGPGAWEPLAVKGVMAH